MGRIPELQKQPQYRTPPVPTTKYTRGKGEHKININIMVTVSHGFGNQVRSVTETECSTS